ncbi:MAG: PIN domain-containing protein [Phycisphaerae bacterium]
MTSAFADTSYWVAIIHPRDSLHDKAIDTARELAPLRIVTTEMVLVEFLNFFSKYGWRLRESAIRAVHRIVSDPNTLVISQTPKQFERACQDYGAYRDKRWSLTDCASFNAMNEYSLGIALTEDEHFEQRGYVAALRNSDS